jgi:phosphohistidine phosphatase SixA
MKISIIRHGHSPMGYPDHERQLDSLGRDQVTKTGEYLKSNQLIPTRIYHSDYTRAQQTASILADFLNLDGKEVMQLTQDLRPSSTPECWENPLLEAEEGYWLLVTHMPFIANFVYHLTDQMLSFPPATLATLEKSEHRWKVVGHFIPRVS